MNDRLMSGTQWRLLRVAHLQIKYDEVGAIVTDLLERIFAIPRRTQQRRGAPSSEFHATET